MQNAAIYAEVYVSDKEQNIGDVASEEKQDTAQEGTAPRRRSDRRRYKDAWGVLGYWIEDQEG
jgi:hypothetical protein